MFIFIMGVEGSGHHMMQDVLKPLISNVSKTLNINKIDRLNYFLRTLDLPNFFENMPQDEKTRFINKKKFNLEDYLKDLQFKNFEYFYYSPSYPFGLDNRMHSIPSFPLIYNELKIYLNNRFKVIYLNRNLSECSQSIFNRQHENNEIVASRTIFNAHNEILNQLNFIRKFTDIEVFEVDYDKIKNNKNEYKDALANFLSVNSSNILTDNVKDNPKKEVSPIIDRFFNIRNLN